jgi:hypothetical protein
MRIMRILAPAAFLFFSIMLCASKIQAQACGWAFAHVTVSNSGGNVIPDVTIELIAEETGGKYYDKSRDEAVVKISPGMGTAVKVSAQDAVEIVKQSSPMTRTEDFCENALRQLANSTKVKRHPAYVIGEVTNFGYCTQENYSQPFLLKVSAPGYVTDYYLGPFLGGCPRTYEIVLTKRNGDLEKSRKSIKRQPQRR